MNANVNALSHHDVIVLGDRSTGMGLVGGFGMHGVIVLSVARIAFPRGPAVSSPFILSRVSQYLPEIG